MRHHHQSCSVVTSMIPLISKLLYVNVYVSRSRKYIYGPFGRISSFIMFSNDLFQRINWDIMLMLSKTRSRIYCKDFVSKFFGMGKLDAINVMCLFILGCYEVDERSFRIVSTWPGGAWHSNFRPQVVIEPQVYDVFVSLAHNGMFSVVSVRKIASFYLQPNSCLGLCCRNLPPDGFVYVSTYNPSSVCSMSWKYLQVNDGLMGFILRLCHWIWDSLFSIVIVTFALLTKRPIKISSATDITKFVT